jgi:IS4 transposase
VIRCQNRPVEVIEERVVSKAAREARVSSDQIVRLGKSRGDVGAVDHPVRRIVIDSRAQGRLHPGNSTKDQIILLTSLTDVPAEVIAAMYSLRWTIELFFRWLKHLLGCRHLLSEKSDGVTIRIYCALIASLLLAQITRMNVGRRAFNLVCLYLQGWADADELAEGLARIQASQSARKSH